MTPRAKHRVLKWRGGPGWFLQVAGQADGLHWFATWAAALRALDLVTGGGRPCATCWHDAVVHQGCRCTAVDCRCAAFRPVPGASDPPRRSSPVVSVRPHGS